MLFYVASRGHHADIGGKTPGSAPPDSVHIEEEGVLIDNFKMIDGGTFREAETRALLASGKYPCRNIDENMADLAAQVAANETGVREVQKMIRQFGLPTVHAYMGHVQANAEECVRRVITALRDGSYDYELDNGEFIRVAVRVNPEALGPPRSTSPALRTRTRSTTTHLWRSATRWCSTCSARWSARISR